jgi:hypothetical protein
MQQPERRVSAEESRLNEISNEVMRRVHTVIDAQNDKIAAGRPNLELTALETAAVFRGAAWGIAALVSMMRFEVKPGKEGTAEQVPPEVEMGQVLLRDFLTGYKFFKDQQTLQVPEGVIPS